MDDDELLRCTVALADGVVLREFPAETVVLQLQTKQYHSLNASAATMLARVVGRPAGTAVADLSSELDADADRIRTDLATLLRGLADRSIVTLEP